MTTKRELEFITAADGTRVPFEEFFSWTHQRQRGFLFRRGASASEETKLRQQLASPQRREVITPLGEFPSMSAAAKAHGLWGSNGIKLRIEQNWTGYHYK